MRQNTLQRIQRTFVLISFVALLGIGLIAARVLGVGMPDSDGLPPQPLVPAAFNRQIVLISGHAGYDSGAVCEDALGNVMLSEADVNARVSQLAARRLRRAGADVAIYDEFDPRLANLSADALVSLHSDSCIEASGFKAAYHTMTTTPKEDQLLLGCIEQYYGQETGLSIHANTVTHDMTRYHAFRQIGVDTPAVILEMGFLGGDRQLLERNPQQAAKGVVESILCYLSYKDREAAK